ncbi:MAG: cell division protein ZapA [Sphingobacteriales bacterium]|nr:MAG: cell division protein ZapA [Sphingobacteriales bacterium]
MADELIPLNVWLAGRSYRIRIKPSEEAAVLAAAKKADDKIMELRAHFAGKDDQDFVAMCLLMYATENITAAATPDASALSGLKDMIARIDDALGAD